MKLLDFSVGNLYLTIGMGMICQCHLVFHSIFGEQIIKQLVAKVGSFVTHNSSRGAKFGEDIFMEELEYHLRIIGCSGDRLYPFRHVIHY